ncbi:MAG: 3-isopropylmalate dehydratase large subunit [Anaerolineaceae bacterium]|nr:3-isopropylmalate dehydratase large subunit [Anaerolineaceae bacterium]
MGSKSTSRTLFQKIWDSHVVVQKPQTPAVLYIDLHLVHEVTSPQAFTGLKARSLPVRRPDKTFATIDHSIPTLPFDNGSLDSRLAYADVLCRKQILQLRENCTTNGVNLYEVDDPRAGIVHIVAPEQGLVQPGMTVVCGDSHTATHGAFGALAFGIGSSEVEHVLATQCLLQNLPQTCEVRIEGRLAAGVSAKDIILALISNIGVGGGVGYVLEYTGSTVRCLSVEERMTICNMSIEAGARAGIIAPDDTTFEYLANTPARKTSEAWEQAITRWRALVTDEDAVYDKCVSLDVSHLEPMITYGTNPGMGMPITGRVPSPAAGDGTAQKALAYMGLQPGELLLGKPIDVVFIGSCTNGRVSDLRQAASVFIGRKVAPGVRALVVPGSHTVRKQAEIEGLDQIFKAAGAEWRQPGCSMCIAMNGDQLEPGQYAVSTSNRNFEGRQGKGSRTFLASPLTAAAAAVTGRVTDVRTLLI